MKKILLHICCAPCGSASVERLLSEDWDVTLYYFMPNIFPIEEWEKRKLYIEKLAKHFGVQLVTGDYNHAFWRENVVGLENEKEGGARCHKCFETLLKATSQKAKELGFEHFATTLTISPHKNSNVIKEIGEKFDGYTHYDFKKKDGYKRSIELSKELNLYRQCYCACEFSMNNGRQEKNCNLAENSEL